MMHYLGQVLSSAAVSSTIVLIIVWLSRELITVRLTAAVRHEYEQKIETFRAQLQHENQEAISKLQKELDLLREKELGAHKDKLQIYRLVVDVLAELYASIQQAVRTQKVDQAIVDRYNLAWVRCYGYLSMLASQEVMDAFDHLNDYILKILNGRSPLQEWSVTREHALGFLNSVRKDVGLVQTPVEYRGDL